MLRPYDKKHQFFFSFWTKILDVTQQRIHSTIRTWLRLEIIDLIWMDDWTAKEGKDDDCVCLTWLDKSELKSLMKDKKEDIGGENMIFPLLAMNLLWFNVALSVADGATYPR